TLASAAAQTLTGTVTNGTTNKPAAGDEVILINLANGMDVGGSTKADSNGKFSFKLKGGPGPHLIRFQADSGSMQGVRLFVVNNTSSPAKTQMNDHNFEFYLPAGAKVEQVQARSPNGQPISAEASPQAEKNRYAINFPLRPGETQFQVEFTLPYT